MMGWYQWQEGGMVGLLRETKAAIEMVLDAGTGWEGYDPTDAEICDAIDWERLRRLVGR